VILSRTLSMRIRPPFGDEHDDFIWTTTGMKQADNEKKMVISAIIIIAVFLISFAGFDEGNDDGNFD
jgi:hypothetical protein